MTRARTVVYFIRALGDAVSRSILVWLSDLRNALMITPLAMVLAGIFCFICGRFVVRDMARSEG
jgi:hypothetical protein